MSTNRSSGGKGRFWQNMDGYRLAVAVVVAILTLCFLLVTIMPIILFENMEGFYRDLKTAAEANRPATAFLGLILFLIAGWVLVKIVRGERIWPEVSLPSIGGTKASGRAGTGGGLSGLLARVKLPQRKATEPKKPDVTKPADLPPPTAVNEKPKAPETKP